MKAKNHILLALAALGLALSTACATDSKKDKGGDNLKNSDEGNGKADKSEAAYASANRVTLTNSLSNNPLTSQTISDSKAEGEAQKFSQAKDKKAIEARIAAERLARKSAQQVLGSAKKLAELEMEKGAGKSISPDVKLDIALAALETKNFALAEYYLQDLTDKGTPARVKAGAYNAMGVVALKDDRVPEAVLYFREALKAVGNYKPALLNLGFAALKGGDMATAKKALGDLQSDWFVQYGLISVARMGGDDGRAAELCDKVLGKEPGHKAALFNCGLFEFQNKHNFAKAKELLNRSGKAKGGESGWDEKASQVLAQVSEEEAQQKKEAPKVQAPPKQ